MHVDRATSQGVLKFFLGLALLAFPVAMPWCAPVAVPAVRLRGSVLPLLAVAHPIANPGAARTPLTVTVVLRRTDQAGLDRYLRAITDPGSPLYRHYLTQVQIRHRFGPSRQAYQTVMRFMRGHGLHVIQGSGNRLTLTLRGTRAQVERTLHVRIRDYSLHHRDFFANDVDPVLPAPIASRVQAVLGLSDLAQAVRIGSLHEEAPSPFSTGGATPASCELLEKIDPLENFGGQSELTGVPAGVAGEGMTSLGVSVSFTTTLLRYHCAADILNMVAGYAANGAGAAPLGARVGMTAMSEGAQRRRVSASVAPATAIPNGTGQTVGLLELSNYHTSDVQDFLTLIGIPNNIAQLSDVNVGGGAGAPVTGQGEGEALMDIDAVMSVAPGAKVVVYDSPFNGPGTFQALLNAMISGGVNVISNSWAYCENETTLADVQSLDSILQNAAAAGITVLTGSGDSGSTCLDGSPDTVAVPADSPNLTAVGGTTAVPGIGGTYGTETWWSGGQSSPPTGSGGFGVSRFFPAPAYQSGLSGVTMRSVPDLAIPADPAADGVLICQADAGGCPTPFLNGGTSLAAPLLAGMVAVMDQRLGKELGFLNPLIYPLANSSAFHSAASLGSDFAHVGLGSPDLGVLMRDLAKISVGAVSAGNSYVTAFPLVLYADGKSQSGVTVQLLDANYEDVSGQAVTLTANSGSHAVITPVDATSTVDNGAATFTVTDTVPETVTLTASTAGGPVTQTAQINFVTLPATAASIAASPTNVASDGSSSTTITVTLHNAQGQGAAAKSVNLSQGSGHSVVTAPSPAVTNANGQIQFTATDSTAETVTYTATDLTDGDLPVPGSATVTFGSGTGTPPCGTSPAITPAAGYAVTSYVTGFPSTGCVGPVGLAFDQAGNLYVSDLQSAGFGGGQLYRFPPGGGIANLGLLPSQWAYGFAGGLAFSKDGTQLYLATQICNGYSSCAIFQVDPTTGAPIRTVASGTTAFGLATDPLSGDLFAAATNSSTIVRISNPESPTPTESVYSTLSASADGLTFAPNGTLYARVPNGDITEIDGTNSATPGAATIIATVPGNPDGIAVAMNPANPSQVSALFVNTNSGAMYKLDLTQNPVAISTVFTGGSRGDFVTVGPDGCLYATQTDQIVKVSLADGTCPFAPSSAATSIALAPATVSPNPTQSGTATLTATLSNVASPAGTPVYFTVQGANNLERMVHANASGQAAFTYTGVDSGSDVVRASTTLDGSGAVSNAANVSWTPGPHATFLSLNPSAVSAVAGQAVTLSASLSDTSVNPIAPVANQTISLGLGGGLSCNALTNASGLASCALTPTVAGTGSVTAAFAGDSQFAPASTAKAFSVLTPPPPAPTVTIAVSPASVTVGSSSTLTWSSTNATACTASGAWSGSEATSGTQAETPATTGTSTYSLDCTGSGGSTTASASLTVTKIVVTGSSGGGGGGGALDWETLGALALLVLGLRGGSRGDPAEPARVLRRRDG